MLSSRSIICYLTKTLNPVLKRSFKTKIAKQKIVNSFQEYIGIEEKKFVPLRTDEISKFLRAKRLTLRVSENSRFFELSKKIDDYSIRMIINTQYKFINLD